MDYRDIQKLVICNQQLKKRGFKRPWKLFKVFNDELFNTNLDQPVITLKSEVIACKQRKDKKYSYIIRWHPEGM